MASFFSFLIRKKIPSRRTIASTLSGPLTPRSFLVYAFFGALLIAFYILLIILNNTTLITIPARGGSLTEGIIGTPKYLNPILATTETDRALTKLVYAGLMKEQSDGMVVPELAERYEISPDGLSYTFFLKPTAKWNDGKAVTSEDVVFTIELLQNSLFNTSTSTAWQNISVDAPDEYTAVITIPTTDDTLLQQLTIGIIPKHIWNDLSPEDFIKHASTKRPISAGAFTVRRIQKRQGVIDSIYLKANHSYALGRPVLDRLAITTYPNQTELARAITSNDIHLTSALSTQTIQTELKESAISIAPIPTTETIALYRNTNESVLGNATLLTVLEQFIDKNIIAATVEHGYGTEVPRSRVLSPEDANIALKQAGFTNSNGTLLRNGSPVVLSIATENSPRALETAQALTGQLLSLGISISVRAFDPGTLQADINTGAHGIVLATSHQKLPDTYRSALTLYTVTIPSVTTSNVYGVTPDRIASPPLRYANVTSWYTNTDKLWPWIKEHYSK